MSAINSKVMHALFPLLAAAALTAGLTGSARAQQTTVRTQVMSDGCDYTNSGAGWVRVGCTYAVGDQHFYRNDREGGEVYIWAAGSNSPFWQRVSEFNAQVARNQAPPRSGLGCSSACEGDPMIQMMRDAQKSGDTETMETLKHIQRMNERTLMDIARDW